MNAFKVIGVTRATKSNNLIEVGVLWKSCSSVRKFQYQGVLSLFIYLTIKSSLLS